MSDVPSFGSRSLLGFSLDVPKVPIMLEGWSYDNSVELGLWSWERMPRDQIKSRVYFIQQGYDRNSPIKIGFSKRPNFRKMELQTGNPQRLNFLAIIPGTESDERLLHQRFASTRLEGEWFESTPELLALIEDFKCL